MGENGFLDARYNPAKFIRNQLRALLSNRCSADKEPAKDGRKSILFEEFLAMLGRTFAGFKQVDIMAVLKRAVTIIGGRNAISSAPRPQGYSTKYRWSDYSA